MPRLPLAGDKDNLEERGVLTEPPLLAGLPAFAGKFIPLDRRANCTRAYARPRRVSGWKLC